MERASEKELFEKMPVHKAVAALAVPTIISQIVGIVYNLADTFFIGRMGNPYMVAAATLVYPWFALLTALGNLFGIGGSSLAVPFQSINALIIYTLQAMGKGTQSTALTLCRQGLLNIPLLICMDHIFGLYGMIWTQLVIELCMLPMTTGIYRLTYRKLQP